jgi:hypothetical protein
MTAVDSPVRFVESKTGRLGADEIIAAPVVDMVQPNSICESESDAEAFGPSVTPASLMRGGSFAVKERDMDSADMALALAVKVWFWGVPQIPFSQT